MWKKKLTSGFTLCLIVMFAATSTHAEKLETTAFGFVMGLGRVNHRFSETDEVRKAKEGFYDTDEIDTILGYELYGEHFVTDEIAVGLKYQKVGGGIEYTGPGFKLKRIAELDNYIAYGNFLLKVGSGFWRLGLTGGMGGSKYTYSEERKCTENAVISCLEGKEEASSTGPILIVGFIADWGEDGAGGRMGFNSVVTDHPEIEWPNGNKYEVKGSGDQLFIDFRYAF